MILVAIDINLIGKFNISLLCIFKTVSSNKYDSACNAFPLNHTSLARVITSMAFDAF